MTKALILALALLGPVAALAEPSLTTQAAISALYVAGDEAQRALTAVQCDNVSNASTRNMSREATRQANHVLNALQAAYDASDGSDASLEIVLRDFCAAAYER